MMLRSIKEAVWDSCTDWVEILIDQGTPYEEIVQALRDYNPYRGKKQ